MLRIIDSSDLLAPRPASSHLLNQPTVGVGSPAGASGTGPGVVGYARAVLSWFSGLRPVTIGEDHPAALSRLDRLDGVGGGR